jgi:hypothetical protein
MDDLDLCAKIDSYTTIRVSPIEEETDASYMDEDVLGGQQGYFILRQSNHCDRSSFEILAKASSYEAASEIFSMIVSPRRRLESV